MTDPVYEIYALRYAGPFVRPASMISWLQDMDKKTEIFYYLFVVKNEATTLIVDCGCTPELARTRAFPGFVNPVEVLKRINIDAAKVKNLVISHIHFDHVSGISLFPRANFFVQEREYRFWIEDPIAQRAPFLLTTDPVGNSYLRKLRGSKRLLLVRGDKKIFPGIQLLLTPRHTIGLQSVAVNTAKGTAIIGSDAAHLFSSYRTDIPSAIIADMVAWMHSYDKLRAKASSVDLIFPGHDPALLQHYPEAAEDVTRLV